jgi:hypothetical protein
MLALRLQYGSSSLAAGDGFYTHRQKELPSNSLHYETQREAKADCLTMSQGAW